MWPPRQASADRDNGTFGTVAYRQVRHSCRSPTAGAGPPVRCCTTFRTSPEGVGVPRAQYDNNVRQAVLDRIIDDGLNIEGRASAGLERDFLLDLSTGFVYDCTAIDAVAQLDMAQASPACASGGILRHALRGRTAPGPLHAASATDPSATCRWPSPWWVPTTGTHAAVPEQPPESRPVTAGGRDGRLDTLPETVGGTVAARGPPVVRVPRPAGSEPEGSGCGEAVAAGDEPAWQSQPEAEAWRPSGRQARTPEQNSRRRPRRRKRTSSSSTGT